MYTLFLRIILTQLNTDCILLFLPKMQNCHNAQCSSAAFVYCANADSAALRTLRNLQKTESNAFRFLFYAIAFYELQTTSQVSMP